jgi:hypothetical protein
MRDAQNKAVQTGGEAGRIQAPPALSGTGRPAVSRAQAAAASGQARAMLARLRAGDVAAVPEAMRLAAELSSLPRRAGLTASRSAPDTDLAVGMFNKAEGIRTAVARMKGVDPALMAAKVELVALWYADGEPGYAAELVRTLRAGVQAMAATREAARHG